jgi:hypothetical protein
MLKLPGLMEYDFKSSSVAEFAEFSKSSCSSQEKNEDIFKKLIEDAEKLPFLKYRVNTMETAMITPAGKLDLSHFYTIRRYGYGDTNAYHPDGGPGRMPAGIRNDDAIFELTEKEPAEHAES